ncbi:MAG: hypothetical protein LBT42_00600, partial [Tannerella sp.]|nr:hypothetical protein [Tannerella sp.]
PANRYIRQIKYNGQDYTKNFFQYSDLMKGADIVFEMTDKPNKERGVNVSDAPYSMSNEKK